MCVCVCESGKSVVLVTLLRGADREGEREVLRLCGWRGSRFIVLASVVVTVELPHEAPRRAMRRDVLRERTRRTLSRKSTRENVRVFLCCEPWLNQRRRATDGSEKGSTYP